MRMPPLLATAVVLLNLAGTVRAQQHFATNMQVDALDSPITIDSPTPKFSWALFHPQRAQSQTSYRIIVTAVATNSVVWDSGTVASNKTLNVPYAGKVPLLSDTDFVWAVTFADAQGALSKPSTSTFSTALYTPADWQGAEWVAGTNGSSWNMSAGSAGNAYRATFALPTASVQAVVRARLFIAGLGYYKSTINGASTDDHELGQFVTFQKRVLYDAWDVAQLLRPGCNAIGVQLGGGWFSQSTVAVGPRQLRALLSVAFADGSTQVFVSSTATTAAAAAAANAADAASSSEAAPPSSGAATPLSFSVAPGPVTEDDIYIGESYDGRRAAALSGFDTCTFVPGPEWVPALVPSASPAVFGSALSTMPVQIRTDQTFPVSAGGISQPAPGVYVFDFAQNMACQTTLQVRECPAGTTITLYHGEILYVNGSVHNNFLPDAPMVAVYTCSGAAPVETYRTLFTYFGARYVEVHGYPGVPDETAVTLHFVHSDVPHAGEFSSSNPILNALQHATRYASMSNLMDVPTDCPQRERRGWLGDAQISFDAVLHNFAPSAFYSKWLRDFADAQQYANVTMGTDGSLPDCVPYYDHGYPSADPGWGLASWVISEGASNFFDDDVLLASWYPSLRWQMENWVADATAHNGTLGLAHWGDWLNFFPGPWNLLPLTYAQTFYVLALDASSRSASRLGNAADAQRYAGLAQQARATYVESYYNATTACFGNCTYVEQVFALYAGILPQGSEDEQRVWANALSWFVPGGSNAGPYANHFGGGIVSLKFLYGIARRFNATGLVTRFLTNTDFPSFGHWITTGGATTLWESWDMDAYNGPNSRNHIMFGGSGAYLFTDVAGLDRAPGSRSFSNLAIAPPVGDALDEVAALNVTWASASIDSPMGLASVSWQASSTGNLSGLTCGEVREGDNLTLACIPTQAAIRTAGSYAAAAAASTFSSVVFATFGAPAGGCLTGDLAINATCNAPDSVSVVSGYCVGQSSCDIWADKSVFGGQDPCISVVKHLAVALAGDCAVPVYALDAVVPANAVATVKVPVPAQGSAGVVITEGTTVVWADGAFVPGVSGVASAAEADGGRSIVFSVGSGSYSFSVMG